MDTDLRLPYNAWSSPPDTHTSEHRFETEISEGKAEAINGDY